MGCSNACYCLRKDISCTGRGVSHSAGHMWWKCVGDGKSYCRYTKQLRLMVNLNNGGMVCDNKLTSWDWLGNVLEEVPYSPDICRNCFVEMVKLYNSIWKAEMMANQLSGDGLKVSSCTVESGYFLNSWFFHK